ncbi:MAG: aspartate kinase [Longimicrobiales bacterium]
MPSSLVVLKFGGTSVATADRIRRVAARVAGEKRAGHDVVVVVSAMGDSTDRLLGLAAQVTTEARRRHPRELDMLLTAGERITMALTAMAIRELGVEAISLTGSQAAIITDESHTGARIQEVRATRIRDEIVKGCVVIVAGFQGVSRANEVTTLGRGGSDTTAVALAAALAADRCDIFTDVAGVYTADPRRVHEARLIRQLDYQEMVELATAGARVMHPRAVEIGARFGVPIRVLSSFRDDDQDGTLITRVPAMSMEELALTGLAAEGGYARLTLRGLPGGMEAVTALLRQLAAARVSVDMVVLADRTDRRRQIQVTIEEDALADALPICEALIEGLKGEPMAVQRGLSRVTLVGSGMHGAPGVFAGAFEALREAGIEVHAVGTSAISISVLVSSQDEERTLQTLHRAFDLGKDAA